MGQGKNEDKWPFAGKLQARNPAYTRSGLRGSLEFTVLRALSTTFPHRVFCGLFLGRTQLPPEKVLFIPWASCQEDPGGLQKTPSMFKCRQPLCLHKGGRFCRPGFVDAVIPSGRGPWAGGGEHGTPLRSGPVTSLSPHHTRNSYFLVSTEVGRCPTWGHTSLTPRRMSC